MYNYEKEESANGTLFTFDTAHGYTFYVSFKSMNIETHPLSNLYSLDFGEINNHKSPNDDCISTTILKIIIDYTTENVDNVIHYVCDSMDNRHQSREKLFSKWFELYSYDNWVRYNINYEIPDSDDCKLYFLYNSDRYAPEFLESEILLTLDSLDREKGL